MKSVVRVFLRNLKVTSTYRQFFALAIFWIFLPLTSPATTRYVNASNRLAAAPFSDWSTAATNIQDAIDAASDGDLILVTNGFYQSNGRVSGDGTTNSVLVNKAVTLQSANGSAATLIDGGHIFRCIYLTNGAALIGFTMTNGSAVNGAGAMCTSTNVWFSNCLFASNTATTGGGVYSGTLTNCTLSNNSCPVTGANGGGAYGSVLLNCTLTGNATGRPYPNSTGGNAGGAAAACTLNNCTISGNGAYGAGGSGGGVSGSTLYNCLVSNNHSDADGGGAYSCTLSNCTLTNNDGGDGGGIAEGSLNHCIVSGNRAAGWGGGAYYNVTLTNCIITGNFAGWGAGVSGCTLNHCSITNNRGSYGVGEHYSTLNNCLVANNSGYQGVGGYQGTLNNCTIVSNSASYQAGGEYNATLNNCIIYHNTAATGYYPNNQNGSLSYCCTPDSGRMGCFTNAPLLVNWMGGDFHLQSSSPCINAGNNAYLNSGIDLDGNRRIAGGSVDIGAYEYQTPVSKISYAWLQQYGLATDGSADFIDSDSDGMNNWQEWIAGLNPTNAGSALTILAPLSTNNSHGVTVTWQSVNTRTYYIQRSTNLVTQPGFLAIQSNILGQAGTTSFTDASATNRGPYFYRVGVQGLAP